MNYQEILDEIKPSVADSQKISQVTKEIQDALLESSQSSSVDIEIMPGGSTAKNTYLKGDFDVDLFVRFKSTHQSLSDELELLLSDVASSKDIVLERVHGSRDYFTFSYQDLFFEVVPVKYIEDISQVENVTDMSPLHVKWFQEHASPTLPDDIRLAKQFCKSAMVYGAESFINGVSGHVLDILLVEYGCFENFIRQVSKWTGVTVIDSNKEHEDVFSSLNQAKLVSPLIVVDPVDKERNAAAAVSQEKYDLLIQRCKDFAQAPSKDFFIIPTFNSNKIKDEKKENELLFIIEVKPLKGKKDVVATKILKVFDFIHRHLQLHDFVVRDANWFYEKEQSYLYYYVDAKELESTVLRMGPPVHLTEDVQKFKEVHEDTFEQEGRIATYVKRDFTKAQDCMNYLLENEYVSQRVSSYRFMG